MLGFSPIASLPIGSAYIQVVTTHKIPVEILATIRTLVEQIDMPVEIRTVTSEARVQRWILNSRGQQWILNTRTFKWSLNSQPSTWTIK